MFKGFTRVLIAALMLCFTWALHAQDEPIDADALRDAVMGPECMASCFLGIEPDITSAEEAAAILDSYDLDYEQVVTPNMEGYTYSLSFPYDDPRFPFGRLVVQFWPSPDLDHEVVVAMTLSTEPHDVGLADVIAKFGPPDRITNRDLIYVDEKISLTYYSDDFHIISVNFFSNPGLQANLGFYPDIRPCEEPASLCSLPLAPAVVAFTHSDLRSKVGDSWLVNGVNIPYDPALEITAEIEPQQVGSVVFTQGDTTFVDDTFPYTWPVPALGLYELEARPYSEAGGQGTAGTPLIGKFRISVPVEALRDAIMGQDCVASCFRMITPGVTPLAEAVQTLNLHKIVTPDLGDSSYLVALNEADFWYPFFGRSIEVHGIQPQGSEVEIVGSLTLFVRPITVDEIVRVFGIPDRITTRELVYVDEQLTMALDDDDHTVEAVHLYPEDALYSTLSLERDIRPCVDPAALCNIPRSPAVVVLAPNDNVMFIGDDRLINETIMSYRPDFDVRADIDPKEVGSVVFTIGEITFIDDTYPYAWPVPEAGSYVVKAQPYSEAGGQGTAGTPLRVAFKAVTPAEDIRRSITGPDCVIVCFMGVEPGITSWALSDAVDDIRRLDTYIIDGFTDPDTNKIYTRFVPVQFMDARFPFMTHFLIDDYQPDEANDPLVASITLVIKPMPVEAILTVFNRYPDQITPEGLVYADEHVIFLTESTEDGIYVTSLRLYAEDAIEAAPVPGEDVRPCEEPAVLCEMPSSVVAFGINGIRIVAEENLRFPYETGLEMTFETDPQQVGSVVFTIGETTYIDDTYPYAWPVPEAGSYSVEARPYSEAGGRGAGGTPLRIDFTTLGPAG